jgi:hypothetical protein
MLLVVAYLRSGRDKAPFTPSKLPPDLKLKSVSPEFPEFGVSDFFKSMCFPLGGLFHEKEKNY